MKKKIEDFCDGTDVLQAIDDGLLEVNAIDSRGLSVLQIAVQKWPWATESLIRRGADLNYRCPVRGWTAMHYAEYERHARTSYSLDVRNALLAAGAHWSSAEAAEPKRMGNAAFQLAHPRYGL